MATLYTQAESNIRKTFFFMTGFLIFVIALGWLLSYVMHNYLILIVAIIFSIVQSFTAYWYSDKIILNSTRAMLVTQENAKELYRIVENLCITAGLPTPKIYILNEEQPNAFATGRDKNHAAIAVTKGLLEKLEKSELEGVIAHELSHIGNKDMLLQTVVVVLVGVVAILSNIFIRMSFLGGDDERNIGEIGWIIAIVAAILAPLAATLLRLSISRKREFLADSTGALLTRYPEGLASALEKISKDESPLRRATNSNAHLFIVNPFRGKQEKSWFSKLFMTHPPIEERIKALRGMEL
jgi:heat shock protein HtpX